MKSTAFLLVKVWALGLLLVVLGACQPRSTDTIAQDRAETPAVGDNSQTALDWAGVYRGVLPCADCAGIKTELRLQDDLTYEAARQYVGESDSVYREQGTFAWDAAGQTITLTSSEALSEPVRYHVGEQQLSQLDRDGNRIVGALAEQYRLKNVGFDPRISGTYWKLMTLNTRQLDPAPTPQQEPHVLFTAADSTVAGSGGCNRFRGTYEHASGQRLAISVLATTRMSCFGVEYEDAYLRMLRQAERYQLVADTLALLGADGEILGTFERRYFAPSK